MDTKKFIQQVVGILLEHEPEKVPGGSVARQEWIRVVLGVQLLALELGRDIEFKAALFEVKNGDNNN